MRTSTAALALALAALPFGNAAVAQSFKDAICPEATQYVVAVSRARADEPPQRIYDVVQAAVDAYGRCSKDKLSHGFREAQHYADTRASSFAVVAAHALVAMKRYDDARRELLLRRPMAQQVVDWQSEPEAPYTAHRISPDDLTARGSDHRPSMYRDSAKEIVESIDAQLAEIADLTRDVARPQAQQSAPPPSPHP
jgi:hypothetical protein